ncbi:MAG: TolC family protein [Gemmatimonadota bacterium]
MSRLIDASRLAATRFPGPPALAAAGLMLWAIVLSPAPLAAQQTEGADGPSRVPLTLRDAIDEATSRNPGHRIVGSRADMARAGARSADSRLLPALEAGVGATRSDDPVFAFGTRLRQERFTQADFALDALNRPDPLTDWTMDVGLRWDVLDPTAWAGRSAARSRVDAANWKTSWSRERTEFRTKALYYHAVGTDSALRAAEVDESAARAAAELFRRREERGLLTRADVLQAEAELRAAEARRIAAERNRDRAREELALHLGWDIDRLPVPTDTLTAPPVPRWGSDAPAGRVSQRADVRSLGAAREAASADASRAGLSFLPRLEGFAAWSSHADEAFGTDGTDWTAGLALRWTVFAGFGRTADRQRATATREIARIQYEEAVRSASAEVEQARRDVVASRSGLEATRAAAAAAEEARLLMRRRFEEGLVTAAAFLQSEARAADARSRAVGALVDYNVALARLELVDPGAERHEGESE